ncbi:MAG: hypothetical protein KJ072_06020 [Verrucomicrobia bacterium]|nr:hypothetical protein [Verrucomicrobiota bacterium]
MNVMARLGSRLARWRDWELNPVVVKELRQAVRNWSVTGMLLLFLVLLFGTSLMFLVSQTFTSQFNQRLGAQIFQAFVVILGGASTLFIPLYVGVRLAIERQENNVDLLYISTLTPGRIIRGKFYCGAYMTLLFFSACMPFMAFTNLLRGVDLPTVFCILLVLFLVVCFAVQVGILLACLPLSKPFKVLVGLSGIGIAFVVLSSVVGLALELMRSGVGAMMAGRDFWIGFSTAVGIGFAGFLLLHFLSIALISPASANRALPLRLYLTVLWFLSGGLSFLWVRHTKDTRMLLPWAIVMGLLLFAALFVVISNHDQLSLRVRRRIPRAPVRRALAFLFFNGAAGGLAWVALLLALTFGATWWALDWSLDRARGFQSLSAADVSDFATTAAGVISYLFAYALTALLVHRRLLSGRPPRLAGVLALIIPGALAVVPNLGMFFLNRLTWDAVERLQLGNLFNLFIVRESAHQLDHLLCAGTWLMIACALNARWFVRQFQSFQPLETAVTPPAEATPTGPS